MRILAISGSLRARSLNTAVLRAAARLAPAGVQVELFRELAALPHFNPDDDVEPAHPAVAAFRRELTASRAVLLCSPEYAHGVPGSLKNALDWLVGSGELVDKPVGAINASPRATIAQASLLETLAVMNGKVVGGACPTLPLAATKLDEEGLVAHPEVSAALRAALDALVAA